MSEGFELSFPLIVVLFILLIIIGAGCWDYGYVDYYGRSGYGGGSPWGG
ncbi:YjcZ family sporulation protein [Neobacillus niacini]|nr:YjcZ family sporulation protein [Neobacillus niacini]